MQPAFHVCMHAPTMCRSLKQLCTHAAAMHAADSACNLHAAPPKAPHNFKSHAIPGPSPCNPTPMRAAASTISWLQLSAGARGSFWASATFGRHTRRRKSGRGGLGSARRVPWRSRAAATAVAAAVARAVVTAGRAPWWTFTGAVGGSEALAISGIAFYLRGLWFGSSQGIRIGPTFILQLQLFNPAPLDSTHHTALNPNHHHPIQSPPTATPPPGSSTRTTSPSCSPAPTPSAGSSTSQTRPSTALTF